MIASISVPILYHKFRQKFLFWVNLNRLLLFHSVCVCNFTCRPDETYALVGTAKDLTLNPRSCAGGFIHTYKIAELIDGGYKLEFVHKVSLPAYF